MRTLKVANVAHAWHATALEASDGACWQCPLGCRSPMDPRLTLARDADVLAELQHEGIFEARSLVGEYRFRLKDIGTVVITVRVYANLEHPETEPFVYRVSHYVQTPQRPTEYQSATAWAPSAAIAVRRAIQNLTRAVELAKSDG